MEQTYLFSKKSRDEAYDNDTSYSFKLRRGEGWMQLNKKATKLVEHDDYYEVIGQTLTRQRRCEDLQEYYYFLKNIKDD